MTRYLTFSLLLLSACPGDKGATDTDATTGTTATDTTDTPTTTPTAGTDTTDTTPPDPTTSTSTGEPGGPGAADLLALLGLCVRASTSDYQRDDEADSPANVPICQLEGAVFWEADLDVDCDGKTSPQCNPRTDPAYQDQTSATDSKGDPLDAASLPYVVVPLPSARFDYAKAGLALGSVILIVHHGEVRYGVFGDEGPENIIGEASYAMAESLGIDPDPATGGTDETVTYIAFTGPGAVVGKIEDHAEAVELGVALAAELIANN